MQPGIQSLSKLHYCKQKAMITSLPSARNIIIIRLHAPARRRGVADLDDHLNLFSGYTYERPINGSCFFQYLTDHSARTFALSIPLIPHQKDIRSRTDISDLPF